ncbi:hypothetical protein CFP56_003745 [Quercus suber]|uniref:Uncharacterized protein n=1 Tax=Quercus suber TaxID=58331 RepID=A0AAW0LDR7_QUESU|nr:hypothetical protein CFP56_73614 [Quercus suber]
MLSKFKIGRFVVSASKITELKEKVISLIGRVEQYYPSRVELVLGKLSKCAAAVVKSKTGSFKPTVLFQGANPRGRMDPPLPDTLFGNFVWQFADTADGAIEVLVTLDEEEISIFERHEELLEFASVNPSIDV